LKIESGKLKIVMLDLGKGLERFPSLKRLVNSTK